jgi:hypothetical protein
MTQNNERPIDPVLAAFLHVAFLRAYHPSNPLARPAILRRYLAVATRPEAAQFVQDVGRRFGKPKTLARRRTRSWNFVAILLLVMLALYLWMTRI